MTKRGYRVAYTVGAAAAASVLIEQGLWGGPAVLFWVAVGELVLLVGLCVFIEARVIPDQDIWYSERCNAVSSRGDHCSRPAFHQGPHHAAGWGARRWHG